MDLFNPYNDLLGTNLIKKPVYDFTKTPEENKKIKEKNKPLPMPGFILPQPKLQPKPQPKLTPLLTAKDRIEAATNPFNIPKKETNGFRGTGAGRSFEKPTNLESLQNAIDDTDKELKKYSPPSPLDFYDWTLHKYDPQKKAELEKQKATLENEYVKIKTQEKVKKYTDIGVDYNKVINNDPNFKAMVEKGKSNKGFLHDFMDFHNAVNNQYDPSDDMSDEEKAIINYYYGTGDKKKAKEYEKFLEGVATDRALGKMQERLTIKPEDDWKTRAGKRLEGGAREFTSDLISFVPQAEAAGQKVKNFFTGRNDPVSDTSVGSTILKSKQIGAEGLRQGLSPGARAATDLGMGLAELLGTAYLTGGFKGLSKSAALSKLPSTEKALLPKLSNITKLNMQPIKLPELSLKAGPVKGPYNNYFNNKANIDSHGGSGIIGDKGYKASPYQSWLKEQEAINTLNTKPYANSRPPYGKTQVEDVWNAHVNLKTGTVTDPSGIEFSWDRSRPRKGQWDMGHIPGQKYADVHGRYLSDEMSLQEFLDWYRNPVNYRPELPRTNRGHFFE